MLKGALTGALSVGRLGRLYVHLAVTFEDGMALKNPPFIMASQVAARPGARDPLLQPAQTRADRGVA